MPLTLLKVDPRLRDRYSATYLQAKHPLYKLYLELEEAEKKDKDGESKLTREVAKVMEGRLFKFGQEKIDEAKAKVSVCRSIHIGHQVLMNFIPPLPLVQASASPLLHKDLKMMGEFLQSIAATLSSEVNKRRPGKPLKLTSLFKDIRHASLFDIVVRAQVGVQAWGVELYPDFPGG